MTASVEHLTKLPVTARRSEVSPSAHKLFDNQLDSCRQPPTLTYLCAHINTNIPHKERPQCRRISTICSRRRRHATTLSAASCSRTKPTATRKTTRTFLESCAPTTRRKGGHSHNGCRPTPKPRKRPPRKWYPQSGEATATWRRNSSSKEAVEVEAGELVTSGTHRRSRNTSRNPCRCAGHRDGAVYGQACRKNHRCRADRCRVNVRGAIRAQDTVLLNRHRQRAGGLACRRRIDLRQGYGGQGDLRAPLRVRVLHQARGGRAPLVDPVGEAGVEMEEGQPILIAAAAMGDRKVVGVIRSLQTRRGKAMMIRMARHTILAHHINRHREDGALVAYRAGRACDDGISFLRFVGMAMAIFCDSWCLGAWRYGAWTVNIIWA
jgi:hypothetical protein